MYGSKISSIRLARGYSQEYVATKLGIAQNTYSKIEKDATQKVTDDMLTKIAEVLGVSLEDIKSPVPIIMNFHESPQSGQYNNYHNDIKVIDALIEQLKKKDEQIAEGNEIIKQLLKSQGR